MIFDKRIAFKPYEYPEVLKFREAIKHSRWDVEEFNFIPMRTSSRIA